MPLRVTGSALQTDRTPTAAELGSRAVSLLSLGDLTGYVALFEDATAIDDPHRRYQARCTLVENGLAAAQRRPDSETGAFYAAVAGATLAVLEEQPAEPVLLNAAGVAMYELWGLAAAHALFGAAKRLDPWLAHVQANLAQLAERRRLSRGRPVPVGHADVPTLTDRAKAVAELARPASGMTLSLCMMVRDEEAMLARCLEAAAPAVDEIIIVDTGSKDSTVEIARSFGARVIEREWTGSFSEARNASFDAATSDWVMYLDADEVLATADVEALRALTGHTWREAFFFVETNFTGELDDGTAVTHNAMRMFRNRPEYRFEGRLHEQIAQQLPGYLPERLEATAVRLSHYGYLGAVRDAREKSRRNIELLRKQEAESPSTPFLHFNLGSEYAAVGDADAALVEFERAWSLVDGQALAYQFTPSLISRYVKALRVCGRPEDAIKRADEGLAAFPGFTDLVLDQAIATRVLGSDEDALALYAKCVEWGDAPSKYTATEGCGTYLPRIAMAEIHLSHGDIAAAREQLDHCMTHHSAFFGVILPYATALLFDGVAPDDVAADVEQRLGASMSATARFMLGTALAERSAPAAAETQFRKLLASQPGLARAQVALGEVLLAQKRYADAADVAAGVSDSDALASVAVRTQLFARLAAGDVDGTTEAIARGQSVGVPQPELAVFAGWLEISRGGQPGVIGATSAPLLATVLEALLRVQDFDTFAPLLALVEALDLPPRERRELLAGVYYRRGYLASAAEQWMAVCNTDPDPRALVGLARVAEAQGMSEDAAVFAGEALAREPGNGEAREIALRAAPALAK